MHIAYLSNNEWPGTSPGLQFSLGTAEGFWQAGADCLLLLHGRPQKSSVGLLRPGGEQAMFPYLVIRAPRLGGSKWLFYQRAYMTLRRSKRHVLITRNLNFLPWAVRLRQRCKMRIYYEAHNFWTDPALRCDLNRASAKRQVRLARRWLSQVDGIICISAPLAHLYQKYYPQLPVLTALPGTTRQQPVPRPAFSYTLGYLGSFTEHNYPLHIVMQALAAIQTPPIRLLCIGAKDTKDALRLRAIAAGLGISERVDVYPWMTDPRALQRLQERIDVGVAILADGFLNRLVCPTKILTYLATATPFIATQLEGIASLVQHGKQGLLVPNTPEAWIEALRDIYTDFGRYQHMAQQGYTLATTMSWQHRAQGLLSALATSSAEG